MEALALREGEAGGGEDGGVGFGAFAAEEDFIRGGVGEDSGDEGFGGEAEVFGEAGGIQR